MDRGPAEVGDVALRLLDNMVPLLVGPGRSDGLLEGVKGFEAYAMCRAAEGRAGCAPCGDGGFVTTKQLPVRLACRASIVGPAAF
jgi:hypothetical protein